MPNSSSADLLEWRRMSIERTRHHYLFGAHPVESDLALPALPATPAGAAAADGIRIVAGPVRPVQVPVADWIHHWHEDDGSRVLGLARRGNDYLLRFHGQCDFVIDGQGRSVTAEPLEDLAVDTLEHLLVDQVLPRLLAHRGELVAHASVVETVHGSVLFLGRSGWGKSTLAGLFHQRGHRLLSDDCALLSFDGTGVAAVPTYPSLRLYGDSLDRVFEAPPATARVAAYSHKRRVALAAGGDPRPGRPLRAIYLLNDPATGAAAPAIDPLPPAVACMALVEHSFRLDMTSQAQTAALLRQGARVVEAVPAFSLRYRRDFGGSDALLDLLLGHVDALAADALRARGPVR